MRACFANSNPNIIKRIIELKADLGKENQAGCTALHFACRYCGQQSCTEVIRLLINAKAYIHRENHKGETPIFYAIRGDSLKAAEILIQHGADVNHQSRHLQQKSLEDRVGNTPLSIAEIHKSHDLIALLLQHGTTRVSEKWIT